MVYNNIRREDLPKKFLEVSVWGFNIYDAHEFLGQVIIHLSGQSHYKFSSSQLMIDFLFENREFHHG
jgi:hypothetical protein